MDNERSSPAVNRAEGRAKLGAERNVVLRVRMSGAYLLPIYLHAVCAVSCTVNDTAISAERSALQ
jgi:hypothetical protein